MTFELRVKAASKAAFFHFLCSVLVACLAAGVVFLFWYPHPYGQLSGGRKLFAILMGVDVVCGPLLTLVLFNPRKSRREFFVDMSLVVFVQLAALSYGIHTAYQARPLFLVHEVDRFRVIGLTDYGDADVSKELAALPKQLRPTAFSRPIVVGIRDAASRKERQDVMVESVFGGRDYSQRPEFYVTYDAAYMPKVFQRAKEISAFVEHFPGTKAEAEAVLASAGIKMSQARYLPVLHKQEWVAILNPKGMIIGFLPGDGFAVP